MVLSKEDASMEKKIITDKVVEFCATDVRPFEIIAGHGFLRLAQHFVSLGAKYGDFDVKRIIPHPTTISRHVSHVKNLKQQEIFPIIQQAIQNKECAATTDGWTEDHKKNHFVNMTVHYFNDKFVFQKNVLFTSLLNVKSKTGVEIRKELKRRFTLFGFDENEIYDMPFVTDQGSNFVKAMKAQNYKARKCYAHGINTVLSNTFDKHAPIRIEIILDNCKKIVRYLRQGDKMCHLWRVVVQEVLTRWNSKLGMISSVVNQYAEIMDLLNEKQKTDWSFNLELAREVIRFLIPFKEATDDLEGDKYPTANLILLWRYKLMKHIAEGNFTGSMKTVAKAAEMYMNSKFPVLMDHKIDCFLDPRYRFLKMLPEQERNEVFVEVAKLLEEISEPDDGPPAKKMRYEVYEEQVQDENKHEIELYLQTADYNSLEKKHLVETFWYNNAEKFPRLRKLARRRLCVPASSGPSERVWSCAKRTVDPRRTNVKPHILDDLLFIKDTFQNVSKIKCAVL